MDKSLDKFPLDKIAIIVEIKGSTQIHEKLKSMGIMVGQVVKVTKRNTRTPSVIQLGDCKMAIGKSIMQSIMVRHYET